MSSSIPMRAWPREERPREKLVDRGAGALSTAELLAVVLGTGSEGATALDQARALLDGSGQSLRGLAAMGAAELCRVRGIGRVKAAQLLALAELAKRFGEEEFAPGAPLRGSHDVYAHF